MRLRARECASALNAHGGASHHSEARAPRTTLPTHSSRFNEPTGEFLYQTYSKSNALPAGEELANKEFTEQRTPSRPRFS